MSIGSATADSTGSPGSLETIRGRIVTTTSVTLDATTLGEKQFDLLKRIFPHQKDHDFVLSGCGNVSPTDRPLTFTGTFARLFPWENVTVDVCLFDQAAARHAVIRIPIPAAHHASAYLSQYSVDPDEPLSPFEIAATTSLGDYVQEITFSQTPDRMIFSTLDYTAHASEPIVYPEAWKAADVPGSHVDRGLNFVAGIALDEDLRRSIQWLLPGFAPGEESASLAHRVRVDADRESPWCLATRPMTVSLGIAALNLSVTGTSIALPLARPLGARLWPQLLVEGTANIDKTGLEITAAFNPYYPELSLSFRGFPSLGQLLAHVGISVKDSLPEPISQMLDIKLTRLTIDLDLGDSPVTAVSLRSVAAVSFSLTTADDVVLIKDLIAVKPTLEMQIHAPADPESRSIEGSLKGAWDFEGVKFTTELDYPSLRFYAGMDPDQIASTQRIADRLFPGIDLPSLTLQTMEMDGSLQDKSFSAALGVQVNDPQDEKWGFPAARLKEIRLGMSYANQQLTQFTATCTLQLAGADIVLLSEYGAGQEGLQFEGWIETPLDIGKLISDLATVLRIPGTVPSVLKDDFRITALHVSFNTHSKDFTFTCDGTLKAIQSTVTLDVKHRQDKSFAVHFSGQVTIDGLQFAINLDAADKTQQLLATYHDLYGQRHKVKGLIEPLSPDLAKEVPDSLAFSLHDAFLGYHKADDDAKWLFGVDIEGGLNLSDVKLPDFPLLGRFAPPPDQTLKLAVQVVGANKAFSAEEVTALSALQPGLGLPHKAIEGLTLAASLRLGQEVKQLSLPIGLKKNEAPPAGTNPLVPSAPDDAVTAATPYSAAHGVSDDGTDGVQWMMIQKSFGPLHFERVGIAYIKAKDPEIRGLLDAAFSAGGLTIALDGLSVTSPLTRFEPRFSLRGLGIEYSNGPLEIAGAFLKREMSEGDVTYTTFAGLAVLRTPQLNLSAIGSYALKSGHPSLFIYAILDYPLGGPSFFFVTGLAAGFGYNRALTIPTIEDVESFPLVRQAIRQEQQGATSLPIDQKQQQALLTERLEALEQYIPPSVGEHFLAIGLRFTSFNRINSFALLTVKFGKELEFDLLGLSTLKVPEVAEATLALKATFKPETGFLGVRAQLAPTSYLLSQRCHLTGGFAFYCWFKDQPSLNNTTIRGGDFVLTLGGYHPLYDPPAHYPRVPRLAFNWQVDQFLQIKGDAYCAMTPQALMAGGHLEATWQKDQLKAWFIAGADFLMAWQPYHYDVRVYVDLGASYTFDLFGSHTVTLDLGADLHLWGPEFSGEATIHWTIISFTVSFGSGASQGITPIQWPDFKKAFLPDDDQVCGIAVQQGLIRQIHDGNVDRWIVNPKDLMLVTNAVIPSTEVKKDGHPPLTNTPLAIRPMGLESIMSTHTITITDDDKQGKDADITSSFDYTPVRKAMPAALWGAPAFTDENKLFLKLPSVEDKTALIEGTLSGCELRPRDRTEPGKTESFEPRLYETELVTDAFAWEDWMLTGTDLQGKKAREKAAEPIDSRVFTKRSHVLKALGFGKTDLGPWAGSS